MVLTIPAHGSFYIIARYTGLGAGSNPVLPLKARVGRTCEALGSNSAGNENFATTSIKSKRTTDYEIASFSGYFVLNF
jgi:hypothetical protein